MTMHDHDRTRIDHHVTTTATMIRTVSGVSG